MIDKVLAISDIKIGDMVFFSGKKIDNQSNYWMVLSKGRDGNLTVTTKGREMQIGLKDIQAHRPTKKVIR